MFMIKSWKQRNRSEDTELMLREKLYARNKMLVEVKAHMDIHQCGICKVWIAKLDEMMWG